MTEIHNIIFDLGGVIINLDPGKTRQAFMVLGARDFDRLYSPLAQVSVFDLLDKGNITPHQFRSEVRNYLSHSATDVAIDRAWNAMLLDVPAQKLQLLGELKKDYRLFLLSNTNVIHVAEFSRQLQNAHGSPDFTPWFERCYYSCNIGMRKPDREIFMHVLNENGLLAAETLFIDDSKQHIEGAAKCGIRTALYHQGSSLGRLLKDSQVKVPDHFLS